MRILIFAISLFLLCKLARPFQNSHHLLPPNTCPYFQYKSRNGIYFGELNVPTKLDTIFDLTVNVSMTGLWRNLKLNLQLLTPPNELLSRNQIKYYVHFPVQQSIPKITDVIFNDKLLCHGDGFMATPMGVTSVWGRMVYQLTYNNDGKIEKLPEGISTTTTTTTTTTSTEVIPEVDYRNELIDSNDHCGIPNNIQSLILNGENVEDNEFPWLVAIFRRAGISYDFQCTANLITRDFIITAAHCVQFYKAPLVPKEDLLLILGHSDLTRWATSEATIRSAVEIIVHPDYRQFSGHCDVALIKFNKPIAKPIRPICLSTEKSLDGNTGIVAGWGKDEDGNKAVPNLRKIQMPMVTQETCLRSDPAFYNLTSEFTFCAGSQDGSGPCTGDSGAGFMLKHDGKWYLRGLVSTAKKNQVTFSCNLNNYVVFADISKLYDWIQSVIS